MFKITFTVKKWLSDEEFKELLQIADYLGRDPRLGSKFELNIDKIRLHNLSIEEVIEILEEVGVELSLREIKQLENSINLTKARVKVTIRRMGSEVALIPHTFLGDVIEDIRPYMRYDRERRIFIFKPYHFFEIVEELKSKGVEVIDETNFKEKMPLPFKPRLKVELRSYQKEALQAWIARGGRGVIALPTGSGKTIIGLAAVSELSERTLIVTYTREQMFQWADFITRMTDLPKEFIGLYYGGEKRIAPITISTYQTAFRYVDRLAPHFSLLIVDEVHHLPADKFKHIAIHMPARKRMGLSATVIREDGKHEELFPLMGGIVYYKFADELIAQGYLAPYKVITIFVKLNKEEKKKYLELIKKYKELAKDKSFEDILNAARRGDPIAIEALKIRTAIRILVHNASSKKEAVKKIVNDELMKGSKILVFTQYIEQAEGLSKVLNAPVITGELDPKTRKRRLEEFKKGISKVLVVTTVGDEGIDIPDANVGIVVAGTSSRRQFIQRLGRLLRPGKGKEARLYEIVVKGTHEEAEAKKRKTITISDLGL